MLNLVGKDELKMELQLKQSLVVWSVAKCKMNTGLLVFLQCMFENERTRISIVVGKPNDVVVGKPNDVWKKGKREKRDENKTR